MNFNGFTITEIVIEYNKRTGKSVKNCSLIYNLNQLLTEKEVKFWLN